MNLILRVIFLEVQQPVDAELVGQQFHGVVHEQEQRRQGADDSSGPESFLGTGAV